MTNYRGSRRNNDLRFQVLCPAIEIREQQCKKLLAKATTMAERFYSFLKKFYNLL